MQWGQQQDTEPGEFVLLLMCVVVCMYVCSAIVKTAETEMPSITKVERPWQGLWVLIILPAVCNETGKHSVMKRHVDAKLRCYVSATEQFMLNIYYYIVLTRVCCRIIYTDRLIVYMNKQICLLYFSMQTAEH